ncbi:MAG: CHAD domain-containing protein [Candidatus Omnitrophica bacterium]|nr:CHAD domain-containing protein [Candidatus Omnitrophota bacterium]
MMNEQTLFSSLIAKHIRAIESEVKGVRKNKDIEPLHQMRVSLRRLKGGLSDFKDVLPAREYELAIGNIQRLLRSLGQARDIDTKIAFLNDLLSSLAAQKHKAGILEIIDELREDRNEIQPRIQKNLARLQQKHILRSIMRLKPSLEEAGMTLDEFAKNRILARLEKMFSLEPYVRKPACSKELHKMRIAAKNLRYTLENFQRLYGSRKVRSFSLSALKVQKALGEVHNYDVWLGLMAILKESSGRDWHFRRAVNFLSSECGQRRLRAYQDFIKLWAGFKRRKTWARLSFFTLDRQ